MNPFDTTGQTLKTQIRSVVQNIGKSLEGGKMTDSDRAYYESMLPQAKDSPEVAMGRVEVLERMLQTRKKTDLDAFGRAGLNVSNFEVPVPNDSKILHAEAKGKKGGGVDLGTKAFAAAPAPDFHKMSDDELKKYLGHK